MSERIDHVESAINNGQAAEQTDDLQEAGVHAQHAIAHGILALVEVQAKANEIAERVHKQNEELVRKIDEVTEIARVGWEAHNRLAARLEAAQERKS
ncbi:hypothetical protein [uncultured Microbacterium sp.]|uniref:hypothetical protein n=1 Tax=uncultured Microbacterium sp. TaxID=191216 RepID=UPI0025D79628|nr:hypothetical protein [uncultured Microbacterium sp.]